MRTDKNNSSLFERIARSVTGLLHELHAIKRSKTNTAMQPDDVMLYNGLAQLRQLPIPSVIFLLTFDPPRLMTDDPPLPNILPYADWAEFLQSTTQDVVATLQAMHALQRSSLATHLSFHFTSDQLQQFLRNHNLPTSGSKSERINRLIQTQGDPLWELVDGITVIECVPWAAYGARHLLQKAIHETDTQDASTATSGTQPAQALHWRNGILWILSAAATGVIGNRTDAAYLALQQQVDQWLEHLPLPDLSGSPPIPYSSPTPSTWPAPERIPAPPDPPSSTPNPPRLMHYMPIDFDWVTIPAGEFLMGSNPKVDKDAREGEQPQFRLYLPEYHIARVPITVAQFSQFVRATGYKTTAEKTGFSSDPIISDRVELIKGANWTHPRGPQSNVTYKINHPVTCISWDDALAFCEWAQVRLATEAEWEKAARGTDGRIYPWGNQQPTVNHCNYKRNFNDTTAVGSYPKGTSPYGCLDMSGNVWEWTSTKILHNYENYESKVDNKLDNGMVRIVRGGSFGSEANSVRLVYRSAGHTAYGGSINRGFRVVLTP